MNGSDGDPSVAWALQGGSAGGFMSESNSRQGRATAAAVGDAGAQGTAPVPAVGRTVTWNAPVETNAGTVTVAGTVATAVLLLASDTVAPPLATGAANVRVADVPVVPVWTVDGSRVIEASAPPGDGGGGAVTVSGADRLVPL